ncbi:MAG TPA: hypothetical protein VFR78_13850, partial [Pyrinomonadaceae bacterium]|nr:hypothetical protein [Pyrinomonadaceae bacterium]
VIMSSMAENPPVRSVFELALLFRMPIFNGPKKDLWSKWNDHGWAIEQLRCHGSYADKIPLCESREIC